MHALVRYAKSLTDSRSNQSLLAWMRHRLSISAQGREMHVPCVWVRAAPKKTANCRPRFQRLNQTLSKILWPAPPYPPSNGARKTPTAQNFHPLWPLLSPNRTVDLIQATYTGESPSTRRACLGGKYAYRHGLSYCPSSKAPKGLPFHPAPCNSA